MFKLLTYRTTFEKAASGRIGLPSNVLVDGLIVREKAELPRIWTGTIVAYPKQYGPFSDNAVFNDPRTGIRHVLETKMLKGERGVALVLESGAYDVNIERGERIYAPKSKPIISIAFPQENGWCDMDESTALPIMGGKSRRFIWRLPSEAVLPVVRESGHTGWARFDIFLNQRPSLQLHSLAEHPGILPMSRAG